MSRLIVAILALSLLGCSSGERATLAVPTARHALRDSGGAFTATYAGNFKYIGCAPPDGSGRFEARGVGSASFIHQSLEHVLMSGNVFNGCAWSGTATLENATFH